MALQQILPVKGTLLSSGLSYSNPDTYTSNLSPQQAMTVLSFVQYTQFKSSFKCFCALLFDATVVHVRYVVVAEKRYLDEFLGLALCTLNPVIVY